MSAMVKMILVRHGYSVTNKEKKYTGQMDVPLDERGVEQAEQTAAHVLANYRIDAVYSSDLSRAVETIRPIAETLQLPIHTDVDLREVYLGGWQGRFLAEVQKEESFQIRSAGGDGDWEKQDDFLARCKDVIRKIALENEGKTVLIGTHGGVVNTLMRDWLGETASENIKFPGNASISVIEYDTETDKAEILVMGYDRHLFK